MVKKAYVFLEGTVILKSGTISASTAVFYVANRLHIRGTLCKRTVTPIVTGTVKINDGHE